MLAGNMPACNAGRTSPNLYLDFTHEAWGRLRADTPLTLSEADLAQLRGLNERVSLDEVVEIYLPLSRLLNLYVAATQELYRATATFLGSDVAKVPYVIGMAAASPLVKAPRRVSCKPSCPAGRTIPRWTWSPRTASSTRIACWRSAALWAARAFQRVMICVP